MRTSAFLLATVKETPSDAELASHKLMIRSGMIRKLASGLYTWLPLGLRVLRKVEAIVREEMNNIGAQEMLMPIVQPAELWEETGRWEDFGPQLLKATDRHERSFCLGPTHEEVITDFIRGELKSYKQLPCTFYQIQTKFRDEIRPRFGVMRAREFIMKDAYSFHLDNDSLEKTYQDMYQAYKNIFDRIGFKYRAVLADTGAIGGAVSHEFHALAESGEDAIVYSPNSDYAANIEKATHLNEAQRSQPTMDCTLTLTPNITTVEAQAKHMGLEPKQILKTLLVKGSDSNVVALLLRGNDELNELKAEKSSLVQAPLTMASLDEVQKIAGCKPGFIGPKDLNIPIVADPTVMNMSDFSCGANLDDQHFIGVNWIRDLPEPELLDIRTVRAGDMSPDGSGPLDLCRGIEVGHIFQLGDKYSTAMKAGVLDAQGKQQVFQMGCYGIGVSRIVAAAIEQSHDEQGIIWQDSIAPFHIALVPMNYHKSHRVQEATDKLYEQLSKLGYEILFDDRKERPGVMFKDMELMGIPHRIVVGEKSLDLGEIEYKHRTGEKQNIQLDAIVDFLASL